MTKIDSFDDPDTATHLFVAAPESSSSNAWLGRLPYVDPWYAYAWGYREAADNLVDDVIEGRAHPLDVVVYPIVFLYRQYLELKLKSLIPLSGTFLDLETKFGADHSLMNIWKIVRPRLETIWPDDTTGVMQLVEQQLKEFEYVDPNSYSFRYPDDKSRKPYPKGGLKYLDVQHLKDEIEQLANILDGSAIGIKEMQHQKNEAMEEHQRHMADYYYDSNDFV